MNMYVKKVDTQNTGGGCMVDIVHLENGHVLGINDEYVCLYESERDFYSGHPNRPTIDRVAFEKRMRLASELTVIYNNWCLSEGLPLVSMDEQEKATPEQQEVIDNFTELWEVFISA
jgi:hypothetical protein